jgi:putative ubiquitin-RnfH superfamily antitoxin RatB of RatAB toxin-antitoxin module
MLRVEVVYSDGPRSTWCWRGELPEGASLEDALRASGLLQVHPDLDPARCAVGVWGRKQALRDALRDRDRVEVYRPLKVDPKEARRLRYRQHLAGLEARRKRPSG